MRCTLISLTAILLALALLGACMPVEQAPPDFRSEVQAIHQELMEEYGTYDPEYPAGSTWVYSYNPMIYAAWVYKGNLRVDQNLETRLREGYEIFQRLDENRLRQVAEGVAELDRDRFLALIEDETLRARTGELIDDGIPALNAFARAFMEGVIIEWPDTPEMILRLLGQLYEERPEIGELPAIDAPEDEDTKWRDWLHVTLAASGEPGMQSILEWDDQIEGLQDLVPDQDFWEGRLSHAYTLRSLQLARGKALDRILEELSQYREGGEVSGFHKWMYWNLGWSISSGGSMFPYTEEDISRTEEFLEAALLEGPLGDGEEAMVAAEALGRAPTPDLIERFSGIATNDELACERRQTGYKGLVQVLRVPPNLWAGSPEDIERIPAVIIPAIEKDELECGNLYLLRTCWGLLNAFTTSNRRFEAVELPDSDMVRIHAAIMDLLPQLTTADEREIVLDMFLWALAQPDFMMRHPELPNYRDTLLAIHEDWSQSTTFEDSEITEEEFNQRLRLFRNTLGGGGTWVE